MEYCGVRNLERFHEFSLPFGLPRCIMMNSNGLQITVAERLVDFERIVFHCINIQQMIVISTNW